MSDRQNILAVKPFRCRGLAGFLDFLIVFFIGGYLIGAATRPATVST